MLVVTTRMLPGHVVTIRNGSVYVMEVITTHVLTMQRRLRCTVGFTGLVLPMTVIRIVLAIRVGVGRLRHRSSPIAIGYRLPCRR
jgi:hypothetical protein